MNFQPLGFIEPFDLVCSLKERIGLFQGTGLRTVHLRAPRKSEPDEYVDTRELQRWPELRAVMERVETVGAEQFKTELDYSRIYLEMLDATTGMAPRRGPHPYSQHHLRLIIGLRCNPLSYLWCPPEQRVLSSGEVVLTSPAFWHGAVNMGEYSRINLVLDIRRPEPLRQDEALEAFNAGERVLQ